MAKEIDWDAFIAKSAKEIQGLIIDGLEDTVKWTEEAIAELEPAAKKLARYLALAQANPEDPPLRLLEHAKADVKLVVAIYSIAKKQNFRATVEKMMDMLARIGLGLLIGFVAGIR